MTQTQTGYVVVDATANDRNWSASEFFGTHAEAVNARQEILGGYGEPVAAGRMDSADVPDLVIRWAGSDGYLYIDRDISPDAI